MRDYMVILYDHEGRTVCERFATDFLYDESAVGIVMIKGEPDRCFVYTRTDQRRLVLVYVLSPTT